MATPLDDLTNEALTDTSKVVDLDEVVVVAQPKEQVRLRLQPVSSNVFGSEQLQQLNVRDLSQLSQYVPSFVMPAYGSRLTSSMYVRGIGWLACQQSRRRPLLRQYPLDVESSL